MPGRYVYIQKHLHPLTSCPCQKHRPWQTHVAADIPNLQPLQAARAFLAHRDSSNEHGFGLYNIVHYSGLLRSTGNHARTVLAHAETSPLKLQFDWIVNGSSLMRKRQCVVEERAEMGVRGAHLF